ncbi:MAG: addiction module toxin, HicA family [Pseudomonadota bacterium]
MKRLFVVQHLIRSGCTLDSEEPTHSNWSNPENDKQTQVPRQTDISSSDAASIYDDLGLAHPIDTVTQIH